MASPVTVELHLMLPSSGKVIYAIVERMISRAKLGGAWNAQAETNARRPVLRAQKTCAGTATRSRVSMTEVATAGVRTPVSS